jgi:hypothetical protein
MLNIRCYNNPVKKLLKILRPFSRVVLPRTIPIGIDVQDRHVALVALKRGLPGGNVEVIWSSQGVAEDAIEDGRLVKEEALLGAVKGFLDSLMFPRLSAEPVFILSLPPEHIYTETAVLPLMPQSDIEKAVEVRLETSLPWSRQEAYVDWKIYKLADPRKIAVFIAAASARMVDGYLQMFLRAKLRVAACEFHMMSLLRILASRSAEPFLMLLLDEDGAEFAVVREGVMYAHFLKRGSAAELKEAIPFEIRRFAAWAEGEFGFVISKIYAYDKVGGVEKLEELQKATGFRVESIPVGTSLATDPRFIIAAGAVRRSPAFVSEELNLVPAGSGGRFNENLILRTFNLWANILAIFIGVMLAAFLGVLFYLERNTAIVEKENTLLGRALERQISFSSGLIQDSRRFNELISALSNARKYETHYAAKLSRLVNEAERHGVTVTDIRVGAAAGPLRVRLRATSRDNIVALKSAIEESGEFSSFDIPAAELLSKLNVEVNAVLQY